MAGRINGQVGLVTESQKLLIQVSDSEKKKQYQPDIFRLGSRSVSNSFSTEEALLGLLGWVENERCPVTGYSLAFMMPFGHLWNVFWRMGGIWWNKLMLKHVLLVLSNYIYLSILSHRILSNPVLCSPVLFCAVLTYPILFYPICLAIYLFMYVSIYRSIYWFTIYTMWYIRLSWIILYPMSWAYLTLVCFVLSFLIYLSNLYHVCSTMWFLSYHVFCFLSYTSIK